MNAFEDGGKWDAWEAKKGMSQDDAKQAYVDLVTPLLQWVWLILIREHRNLKDKRYTCFIKIAGRTKTKKTAPEL